MTMISQDAAFGRIHRSGLTIGQAVAMSDRELLQFPLIGRRTLHFIRSFQIIET